MTDHASPDLRVVVRAVDANRLDASLGQRQHKAGIAGRLSRAGDEQGAVRRAIRGSEDRPGLGSQPIFPSEKGA